MKPVPSSLARRIVTERELDGVAIIAFNDGEYSITIAGWGWRRAQELMRWADESLEPLMQEEPPEL